MIPDRVIVRKIKEFDPSLFIRWNAKSQFFELWIKQEFQNPKLITPITLSIYEKGAPRIYAPLDERIIWWLYAADSHRSGGAKQHAKMAEDRFLEFTKKLDRQKLSIYRDIAKDMWAGANNFFATKTVRKNDRPKFNSVKPENKWVRPDVQARTSTRIFQRSRFNALKYGYQK